MKTINGDDYSMEFDPATGRVALSGSLRLGGIGEYGPMADLLKQAVAQGGPVVLDLTRLEFLNSSGIAMLSRFVIEARNSGTEQLTIVGSSEVPWQGKSLNNLQRLMPSLNLELA